MDNSKIREEMSQIQAELHTALSELRSTVWSKLKEADRRGIEQEFDELDVLLERLKTGHVWLAIVGKTAVGKSSVINSLLEGDFAEVDETHDTTKPSEGGSNIYEREPWKIIDLPGVMGREAFEKYALAEAKRAHGHIFVVDGEPYLDELEMFDNVHKALPDVPKIVFVNKWDVLQQKPTRDRDAVKGRIQQKMAPYVKSADNIVYGSANLYDPGRDGWVRQPLPQLLERMYEDAGTFGQVVNVLDPANRAHSLAETAREKVLGVRMKVARKVISAFGAASAAGTFIPAADLVADPGLMAAMVYTLCRIMGQEMTKERAKSLAGALLKTCLQTLSIEFGGVTALNIIIQASALIPAVGLLALPALGGMTYLRYRRTVILGEVTLEYVKNDFSWGGEEAQVVIKRCKERAKEMYLRFVKEAAPAN